MDGSQQPLGGVRLKLMFDSLLSRYRRDRKKSSSLEDQLGSALDYLDSHGLTKTQFARLHGNHQRSRPSLKAVRKHFGRVHRIAGNDRDLAERIVFVARQHRWSPGNYELMIDRSLEKWPPGR